jgi:hypothetical protein
VVYVHAPFVNLAIPVHQRVVPAVPLTPSTEILPSRDLLPTVDVPPGVTPPVVVLPKTDLTPVLPTPTPLVRPMTLPEFARCFHPTQGTFKVVLIHPVTCCPVTVCFCLPGCPKTVRLHDRRVTFHYGLAKNVVLNFTPDGRVTVRD